MAAIATTTRTAAPFQATVTTLGASDTLAYTARQNMVLELRNTTGSPVVVTVDGSGSSAAVPVSGSGGLTVDLTAGKAITVPGVIGATMVVPLDNMSAYLSGTVAVTGGTGVTATLLSD